MKTSGGPHASNALVKAFRAMLHDSRNFFVNFGKFVAALAAILPLDLLVGIILLILAVLERMITIGNLDRWLA